MEQPLPPNGACLLLSFNLTKYMHPRSLYKDYGYRFAFESFKKDIPPIVRMLDNVIDRTIYPLPEQKQEALNKRRMGIGVTGLANAMAVAGIEYGSQESVDFTEDILTTLRDECYKASIDLAKEKGKFPLFNDKYLDSEFIKTLPLDLQAEIFTYGIRNSHLLSIAPTGTISLWAGNISSGIEPVFENEYFRNVYMPSGEIKEFFIKDYAVDNWGVYGRTSSEISAKAHIDILCAASRLVDSSCSKTCNVGDDVTFDEFKDLYIMAYDGGASGCTTFRPKIFQEDDTRGAVMSLESSSGEACFIDPLTGERSCAD